MEIVNERVDNMYNTPLIYECMLEVAVQQHGLTVSHPVPSGQEQKARWKREVHTACGSIRACAEAANAA